MNQTPFSISPLPGALFLTPSLKAALHKLQYVISNRQGLALLLGDPGVGKSSLLRRLEGDLAAQTDVKTAFIPDPETSSLYAFVRSICDYYEVPAKRSLLLQKDALKDFIFDQASQGNNVVLLLDEAQSLNAEMLETLRSFLNYESNSAKLIQIVMAGQLELRGRLKGLRAIKSRIVMNSLLDSMSLQEMISMLQHRCELIGIPLPFSTETLEKIYESTFGVPRDTLKICAAAYELARLSGDATVSTDLVEAVIDQEAATFEEETEEQNNEQIVKSAKA
jgi:general secretion pathway protein A